MDRAARLVVAADGMPVTLMAEAGAAGDLVCSAKAPPFAPQRPSETETTRGPVG